MNESTNVERMNGMPEPKSNVFLGIIGALVGALLGAVIWVIIYELGVIASIAGVAIIYFSYKGYTLLSKDHGMKGVIIATLLSLIILSGAHFFCWGLEIYNQLGADYGLTLWDSILSVPTVVSDPEIITGFVRDYLCGIVLIFVGAFPYFRQALQGRNQEETV